MRPLTVFFSAAFFVLGASLGHAFPEYSIKENKKCVYCHFNNQGGPTNARGRFYAKHMSFDGYAEHLNKNKLKKKKSKAKAHAVDATGAPATPNGLAAPAATTAPETR